MHKASLDSCALSRGGQKFSSSTTEPSRNLRANQNHNHQSGIGTVILNIPRTWRILALFSGDRRHGDPQKVSGDGGENGKLMTSDLRVVCVLLKPIAASECV